MSQSKEKCYISDRQLAKVVQYMSANIENLETWDYQEAIRYGSHILEAFNFDLERAEKQKQLARNVSYKRCCEYIDVHLRRDSSDEEKRAIREHINEISDATMKELFFDIVDKYHAQKQEVTLLQ